MEGLLALDRKGMHSLWDSACGATGCITGCGATDSWRRWSAPVPSEIQKSLGHSHVLGPEFRSAEGAWSVAHKLLHKAAMRLRMEKFYTASMAVTIRYQLTTEQAARVKAKKHFSGIKHSSWGMEARFADCQDTLTLLEVLRGNMATGSGGRGVCAAVLCGRDTAEFDSRE